MRSHKEALALGMLFVLTLLPDGKGILTTEASLTQQAAQELRYRWKEWAASPDGIVVLAQCRVERVTELALDIDGERITVR